MEPKKCLRCGGSRLEPGAVQSTGRVCFRPANSTFWSLRTADVAVEAIVCLDCGTVEMVADVRKAEALVGRGGGPTAEADAAPGQAPRDGPPWRGLAGFGLLAVVGGMGTDITPSPYIPDLGWYVPRYVLLALAVGFGLSGARSGGRTDRLFGVAVLVAGSGMVAYIARECLRIVGG